MGTRQLLSTWAASWSLGAPDLLSSLLCTPGLQEEQVDGSVLVFFQGQVLDTGIPLVLSVCPPAHWSLPGTKDCANVLMASGEKMVFVVV